MARDRATAMTVHFIEFGTFISVLVASSLGVRHGNIHSQSQLMCRSVRETKGGKSSRTISRL
jgi:hypothetical protein